MSLAPVGDGRLIDLSVPERPFNSGEIVIRPRRDVTALEALTDDELDEISHWLERIESVMERVYNPHGWNMGVTSRYDEGASRLELHVVPRWGGDMNFMPVVAGVKVLPASVDDTVEVYRDAFFEA